MAGHVLFAIFQLASTLVVLVQSQNQSRFISIDCGLVDQPSYTDETTSIYYTSDANIISTGISHSISSKHKTQTPKRQLWTVRSFPEGERNCYTLTAPQGSSRKFLVRAMFMYGNYDGENSLPKFDIYLGADWWDTLVFQNASEIVTKEIIYAASSDFVHVCLLNTNTGAPFISVLELRFLDYDVYLFSSLDLLARHDLGLLDGELVRFPDDAYDRIWTPYNTKDWKQINTSLPVDQGSTSSGLMNYPPSIVMRSAATPANAGNNMEFNFLPGYNASTLYAYMYFAEIQKLQENQTRQFDIFVNGGLLSADISPFYLRTIYYLAVKPEPWLNIWLNRTERSTLPPLCNAIEIYVEKNLSQTQTQETDVDAIMNIKSFYGIKRNWQGDPCTPQAYLWDGLNCSYDGSGTRRITSLNLSSGGLTRNIAPDIYNLKSIEYLDLSDNNLVGEVPSFLAQLQFLKVLFGGNPNLSM
ncbi:probable LRR receptor-like serine/threonine-protein kinase At1g05700 isoform X2 [Prosopis cineraria]|uniref:probable LRR receptor-like serine/threonine-protein kinase At1g05700 isoform X2 n=1 Tax=Prosopis cineraria TaxID=364024 RepID=UPI00240F5343|nr:probable LRR receptor-like serine/threonine-protein kinase At1g05700 isoform X2 [Prosopis cineraria]